MQREGKTYIIQKERKREIVSEFDLICENDDHSDC